LGLGYYELAVYNSDDPDTREQLAKTSFSILDDHEFAPAADSIFGVNTHMVRSYIGNGWGYDVTQEAYAIGAMTIRDGYDWSSAETTEGEYKFDFQNTSSYLKAKNMDYLFITGFANSLYDNGYTPYTQEGRQAFANYSKAAYDYYPGKRLIHQEMYNEWWGMGDRGEDGPADCLPETYIPLVQTIYQTIDKENYPDAVLFGEFGSDVWNSAIVELGISDYMDAAAIHVYPPYVNYENKIPENGYTTRIKNLRTMLDEYSERGKTQPIWLTEAGYTTTINKYGVSEHDQAKYLPRMYLEALAAGAEKIFWYDLIDDGVKDYADKGATHENHFGLLRAIGNAMGGYTPKPAFVAHGVMARAIDGLKYSENNSDENYYDYIFTDGEKTVHAMYSLTGATVELSTDKKVKITDLMGRETTLSPIGGKVTLELDDYVIYVEE